MLKKDLEDLVGSFTEFLRLLFWDVIRKAQREDSDAVFEMYSDEDNNRYLYYTKVSRWGFNKFWGELVERKHSYVYEMDGKVLGFISAIAKEGQEEHVAHISPILVSKGHKRMGTGQEMMLFLLKKLRDDGFKRIELVVNSDNKKGIAFFRKLGFKREATIKKGTKRGQRYYDDYLMVTFF